MYSDRLSYIVILFLIISSQVYSDDRDLSDKKELQKIIENILIIFGSNKTSIEKDSQDIKNKNRFLATEKALRKKTSKDKNNTDLRFKLARVLSWQNKFTEALIEYDWLLNKHPNNSDYILGKSQTLYWSKNNSAALKLLEPARRAQPKNQEIWKLQYSILRASSKNTDKIKAEKLRIQADTLFPSATWHKKRIETPIKRTSTEFETGVSVDILDGTYDDWSSYYVSAGHKFNNNFKIYSVITQTERFKLIDNEYLIGIFAPITSKWNIIFDTSFTPDNKVKPIKSNFIQLQRVFNDGWNAYLGFKKTKYDETDTKAINITLEQYWKNFRFGYSLLESQVSGSAISTEYLHTHTVSSDYFYGNNNLGIAITSGKELEYNGREYPPISDITTVVIRGRYWFNSQWAVNYSTHHHTQGNFYTRYGYQLGLRYRY